MIQTNSAKQIRLIFLIGKKHPHVVEPRVVDRLRGRNPVRRVQRQHFLIIISAGHGHRQQVRALPIQRGHLLLDPAHRELREQRAEVGER